MEDFSPTLTAYRDTCRNVGQNDKTKQNIKRFQNVGSWKKGSENDEDDRQAIEGNQAVLEPMRPAGVASIERTEVTYPVGEFGQPSSLGVPEALFRLASSMAPLNNWTKVPAHI